MKIKRKMPFLAAAAIALVLSIAHSKEKETATVEPVKEAQAETSTVAREKKGNERQLEIPVKLKRTKERIIRHTGHTVSFNREHNAPNYVAWKLTAEEADGTVPRYKDFQPDPSVPEPHRVTTEDYKGSGYDRGHMAPAADMKWSNDAMRECFYMSNICPQDGALNSGTWSTLEKACRRWAKQEGAVYIVCGPVYKGTKHKCIGREHKVTVPEGFFKVVMSLREGEEKAIGFYFANNDGKQTMQEAATTVDVIEELTGMDFFVNVDDKLERKIEATASLKKWR